MHLPNCMKIHMNTHTNRTFGIFLISFHTCQGNLTDVNCMYTCNYLSWDGTVSIIDGRVRNNEILRALIMDITHENRSAKVSFDVYILKCIFAKYLIACLLSLNSSLNRQSVFNYWEGKEQHCKQRPIYSIYCP